MNLTAAYETVLAPGLQVVAGVLRTKLWLRLANSGAGRALREICGRLLRACRLDDR
jgi:hypothetical protein